MVLQMSASQIQNGVRSGKIKIAIIGLGEIGLPQALQFLKEGASVFGVDIDDESEPYLKPLYLWINVRE